MNQDSERRADKQTSGDRKANSKGNSSNGYNRPGGSWWGKLIIAISLLLAGSAGVGSIYGWYFSTAQISPFS